MDDLTKELWQGVTERRDQPEAVSRPPLLVAAPSLPVEDRISRRELLGSRKMAAILALGCVLGLLGIVSADPFASATVSELVSDKLSRPAICTELAAAVTVDSQRTIYRCVVGSMPQGAAKCFAVSGRDIGQVIGSRDPRC